MDLSLRTETFAQDDNSWLGSRHGTDNARPVTLDLSTFTQADHYPNGFLLSGLPLQDLGDGKYGLWTATSTLAGFLLFAVRVTSSGADPSGALLDHGRVVTAKLPVPVDAAGQATNPHIVFA